MINVTLQSTDLVPGWPNLCKIWEEPKTQRSVLENVFNYSNLFQVCGDDLAFHWWIHAFYAHFWNILLNMLNFEVNLGWSGNEKNGVWKGGSMDKSMCCSSREPGFASQNSSRMPTATITPAPGDLMPSLGPCRHLYMCVCAHVHMNRISKKDFSKKNKSSCYFSINLGLSFIW